LLTVEGVHFRARLVFNGLATRTIPRSASETRSPASPAAARAQRERPRGRRTAEQRDELAPPCMSGKQHFEGRRGFGHDRLPVATGSPQALRILNRE